MVARQLRRDNAAVALLQLRVLVYHVSRCVSPQVAPLAENLVAAEGLNVRNHRVVTSRGLGLCDKWAWHGVPGAKAAEIACVS
jgi:hypothetical protein